MTVEMAREIFRRFLVNNLGGKIQASGWINIRGELLCGECSKHKRSALYIYVGEGSPIYLNCFRASCDMKRTITAEDFKNIGFNNTEASRLLLNSSKSRKLSYKNMESKELIIRDNQLSLEQEEYFFKRCKFIPSVSDIELFRIIPDLRSVVEDNFKEDGVCSHNYNGPTGNQALLDNFNKLFKKSDTKKYITYFTNDGKKFFFRSITNNEFVLKGQLARTQDKSIYTITRGETIRSIVLTEGFFDMVNVYKYFCVDDGMVYSCTGGFAAFEYHIVDLYKKYIDTVENLIIFCDSDKIDQYSGKPTIDIIALTRLFKNVFKKIPIIAFRSIYIVYNSATKDFGDMSEKIKANKCLVDLSELDMKGGQIKLIKQL